VRGPSLVVVTTSNPDDRAALARAACAGETELLITDAAFGETLAAAPALAWAVAFDWLAQRPFGGARVVSRGLDGEIGVVDLLKEPS